MTNVIPFEYEEQDVRVIRDESGEPWFVGKDVCVILELENVSMALEKLDDDEKGIKNIDTLGGAQDMATISESGLYTLIVRSNKEAAKPFRRWVTHDVLPSLRKTGQYAIPGADEEADQAAVDAISQLNETMASVNAAVRGLTAVYGRPGYDGDYLTGKGPATSFGARPVSRVLRMKDETVRDFLESCCLMHADASCRPMELHEAYQGWCKDAQGVPLGRNTFYRSLREIAARMVFYIPVGT